MEHQHTATTYNRIGSCQEVTLRSANTVSSAASPACTVVLALLKVLVASTFAMLSSGSRCKVEWSSSTQPQDSIVRQVSFSPCDSATLIFQCFFNGGLLLAKEQKHYATSGEVLYESHRGARGRMPWLTNMMATSGSPFQHAITYHHIQQVDTLEFEQQDTNKLVAKGDRRILKPRVIANRYLNRALLSRAGQTQKVSASERCFGGTPLGFQLQVPSFPVLGFLCRSKSTA